SKDPISGNVTFYLYGSGFLAPVDATIAPTDPNLGAPSSVEGFQPLLNDPRGAWFKVIPADQLPAWVEPYTHTIGGDIPPTAVNQAVHKRILPRKWNPNAPSAAAGAGELSTTVQLGRIRDPGGTTIPGKFY